MRVSDAELESGGVVTAVASQEDKLSDQTRRLLKLDNSFKLHELSRQSMLDDGKRVNE